MKKISHFLVSIIIVALFLCTAVLAAEYDYAHVKTFVDESAYGDITYENGWVQVATGTGSKRQDAGSDGEYVGEGDLPSGSGIKAAYFNETTKTLVIEGSNAWSYPTASYGDYQNSDGNRKHLFPYWCTLNADKVEHLEFRCVGGFNNTAYMIRPLENVQSVKMDNSAVRYFASKGDTAFLAYLPVLTTAGFGSWDTESGEWSPQNYTEDVVDLRGFTQLRLSGTTETTIPDLIMYMGSVLRGATAVKSVILPSSLVPISGNTYAVAEISDGSDSFPLYDGSGNLESGKAGYKVKNSTTGAVAYSTGWQAPSGWAFVTASAEEIAPYYGQFSGMIPYDFARGATSLTSVTVPEDVSLLRIYKNAFAGCTALCDININGTVNEAFVVDAGAFGTGDSIVSGVKIYVNTYDELEIVNNALTAAGYTDRANVKAVCKEMISPIVADGFQV